jgi:hypothetical protein
MVKFIIMKDLIICLKEWLFFFLLSRLALFLNYVPIKVNVWHTFASETEFISNFVDRFELRDAKNRDLNISFLSLNISLSKGCNGHWSLLLLILTVFVVVRGCLLLGADLIPLDQCLIELVNSSWVWYFIATADSTLDWLSRVRSLMHKLVQLVKWLVDVKEVVDCL